MSLTNDLHFGGDINLKYPFDAQFPICPEKNQTL